MFTDSTYHISQSLKNILQRDKRCKNKELIHQCQEKNSEDIPDINLIDKSAYFAILSDQINTGNIKIFITIDYASLFELC